MVAAAYTVGPAVARALTGVAVLTTIKTMMPEGSWAEYEKRLSLRMHAVLRCKNSEVLCRREAATFGECDGGMTTTMPLRPFPVDRI